MVFWVCFFYISRYNNIDKVYDKIGETIQKDYTNLSQVREIGEVQIRFIKKKTQKA